MNEVIPHILSDHNTMKLEISSLSWLFLSSRVHWGMQHRQGCRHSCPVRGSEKQGRIHSTTWEPDPQSGEGVSSLSQPVRRVEAR